MCLNSIPCESQTDVFFSIVGRKRNRFSHNCAIFVKVLFVKMKSFIAQGAESWICMSAKLGRGRIGFSCALSLVA